VACAARRVMGLERHAADLFPFGLHRVIVEQRVGRAPSGFCLGDLH
jgi:hypothetical protein